MSARTIEQGISAPDQLQANPERRKFLVQTGRVAAGALAGGVLLDLARPQVTQAAVQTPEQRSTLPTAEAEDWNPENWDPTPENPIVPGQSFRHGDIHRPRIHYVLHDLISPAEFKQTLDIAKGHSEPGKRVRLTVVPVPKYLEGKDSDAIARRKLLNRAREEGHGIVLTSYRQVDMTTLTRHQKRIQLIKGHETLKAVLGDPGFVSHFFVPHEGKGAIWGQWDPELFSVAEELGLGVQTWTNSTHGDEWATPNEIYKYVLPWQNGDIVAAIANGKGNDVAAFPHIVEKGLKQGKVFKPTSSIPHVGTGLH